MKVVKLNRRHKLYHNGFTHAFRFDSWSSDGRVRAVERALTDMYGRYNYRPDRDRWYSKFGSKNSTGYKTYWVGVRSEHDVTRVLLSI